LVSGTRSGNNEPPSHLVVRRQPAQNGFTRANLFRMRPIYETYRGQEKVVPLVRQLPWSSNLRILARRKRPEATGVLDAQAVERQINGRAFEPAVLNPPKVSAAKRQLHPSAEAIFRDAYLVEFLALSEPHQEPDFHQRLLANLRRFLANLGRDFCFIGSEMPLQVGGRDFALDLLFFHRGLLRKMLGAQQLGRSARGGLAPPGIFSPCRSSQVEGRWLAGPAPRSGGGTF
jgi:predicted nuclease of restriction endonuclease-like (RecB) superfamily